MAEPCLKFTTQETAFSRFVQADIVETKGRHIPTDSPSLPSPQTRLKSRKSYINNPARFMKNTEKDNDLSDAADYQPRETKIEPVKANMRLVVELEFRSTPKPWIHDLSLGTLGDIITKDTDAVAQCQERVELAGDNVRKNEQRNFNAAYIAHAANLGAPMAKALLAAIEVLPDYGCKCEPEEEEAHEVKCLCCKAMDEILASFPGL